jgi:hypothetical protein
MNDNLKFIVYDTQDKPIQIVHSDYKSEIIDGNYVFTKNEHVMIKSEDHLMEYIRFKLREGYNISIINKNDNVTINIKL